MASGGERSGDSVAVRNPYEKIKESLDVLVGRRVRVKANKGRKKIMEVDGILEETYPRIFVITLNEDGATFRRVSYTYADLLTRTIELSVYEKNGRPSKVRCSEFQSAL